MAKNTELQSVIKIPPDNSVGLYKFFASWPLQAIDFLSGCMKMDPHHRLTADELIKHTYFTHDRFPQKFLPALREKVNIEFNNPLLRKFKTEILMSTDKRDEIKSRRSSQNDSRWRFSLTEGSMKRKFSGDTVNYDSLSDKNLISLEKTTQRLNIIQKSGHNPLLKQSSLQISKEKTSKNVNTPKLLQNDNTTEMQMLQKSLQSLVKFNPKSDQNRPVSAQKETAISPLMPESPPPFQSLHFGFGDYNRSPNYHAVVLHPNISNISFSKDPPKRSPNISQNVNSNNTKTSQVPLLSNPKTQFLKKVERNVVVENIFANGDQGNQIWNDAPVWLNSFTTSLYKKKDGKPRIDDFSLPNLPGGM
ncbi:hypothetical protein NQ314_018662 [Rhamnusium bicolor]|uniref:Serine/threonine protein kinase n=1 Tax=Rhamnusium bicolor TaxID=1586634 RepID=A0AAV8WRD1_9CUCU|nr:hypothetical protein NQ314_018662 [Rhamnusium bicolor]